MIGNYIKGMDLNGQPCEGIVLDKVLTLQTIQMKDPNAGIGSPMRSMPVALDAYLVISPDSSMHMVSPQFITAVKPKAELLKEQALEKLNGTLEYFPKSKR